MSAQDHLADLLLRWEAAKNAGELLTPQELCEDHPEHLSDFLQLLEDLGRMSPLLEEAKPISPEQLLKSIRAGRFVPRQFHAQGGLGIVFLAEDKELNRLVALKSMQPFANLDPTARGRFLQEAEITGKLEHPGIAPVYGAGEDEDGQPFYAMRLIKGESFGTAIRRFHESKETFESLHFSRLLRVFLSVCETVAYAHARGIIHRDLKPENIMLGTFGETMVVDWGLAKQHRIQGTEKTSDVLSNAIQVSEIGSSQSILGSVRGTPAFMAPEQARGEIQSIGPPTDVYALGAILYVILSGQPPYAGSSAQIVLEMVSSRKPVDLAGLKFGMPCPLMAVCAKAMEPDPIRRYGSPELLAHDVERFLADQPISVFQDPLATRIRRWTKRNRTISVATLAVLFAVGIGLAIVLPILASVNYDLTFANASLNDSNKNLSKAIYAQQQEYLAADASIRGIMQNVFMRQATAGNPSDRRVHRDTLEKYAMYLEQFSSRNCDRPELRLEVARARMNLGEVLEYLGKSKEALAATEMSLRQFDDLRKERPKDRDVKWAWACCASQYGSDLNRMGRVTEARAILEQAEVLLEEIVRDPLFNGVARFNSDSPGAFVDTPGQRLAAVAVTLAEIQDRTDRAVESTRSMFGNRNKVSDAYLAKLKIADQALAQQKPIDPESPGLMQLKAFSIRLLLAIAEQDSKAKEAALIRLTKQLDISCSQFTASLEFQHLLLDAELEIAKIAAFEERNADVEKILKKAKQIADRLHQSDYGFDLYQLRMSETVALGEVYYERILLAESRGEFDQAKRAVGDCELAVKYLAQSEGLPVKTLLRSVLLASRLAFAADRTRKPGDNCSIYHKHALGLVNALREISPDEPEFEIMQMNLHLAIASTQALSGEKIGEDAEMGETVLRKLLKSSPNDGRLILSDAMLYQTKGFEAYLKKKDLIEAEKLFSLAARELQHADQAGMPGAQIDLYLCGVEFVRGIVLEERASIQLETHPNGDEDALAWVNQALKLFADRPENILRRDPAIDAGLRMILTKRNAAILRLVELKKAATPKK